MTVVKKSRTVPFSCEQMYQLVNNIEHYPDFLPYFSKSQIHHQDEANKMIEMRLVEGPFSHLEGFWRFDETPEGCLISFDLEFEFAGRTFSMFLGPLFEQITDKMVDAFCDRAQQIYAEK
jgi:ribosome-associated toxin RatA of RatAB toxin-antitoxin module